MQVNPGTEAPGAPAGDGGGGAPQDNGGGTPPAQPPAQSQEPQGQPEDDGFDLQVPEGEYVPRSLIQEARNRYNNERGRRLEFEKKMEEWGGEDGISSALELQQHLQTEEGVIDLFLEAGRSLGIGAKQLEQLFGESRGQAPAGEGQQQASGGEDDDQLLTMAEARQMVERALEEKVTKPQAQQQAVAAAEKAVGDTLKQLEVDDAEDANMILQLGDRYLPEGTLDPDKVANAVRRGHADWLKIVSERSQAYLAKKAELNGGVPKTPAGGGAPSPPEPEPPKNTDEAKRRVREKMRAAMGG